MDEERKLVSELQCKLAELDQKVGKYRRDMVAEYERHAENLLRSVPQALSHSVAQTIASSLGNYKALYPGTDACESGSSPGIISSKEPTTSPPPPPPPHLPPSEVHASQNPQFSLPQAIPYRKSAQQSDDSDAPRSPHEREREFQGLFTPVYLPLLGDSRHERRSSSTDTPRSPSPKPQQNKVDASTDPRSLTSTPDLSKPTPRRRDTEDSVVSDTSEGVVRRSALRRSSSASMRSSPRRVRFDVEGVEVLPTSSPQPPSSLAGDDDRLDSGEDEPELEQVEDISSFPDEDEEEAPPLPRRISSSQRLLALSRTASKEDDGTTWTTVSAPPDGSPSIEKTSHLNDSLSELSEGRRSPESKGTGDVANQRSRTSPPATQIAETNNVDHEADTESDDEGLDMPSLRSMKGKKSLPPAKILSPAVPPSYNNLQSPATSNQISDRRWKEIEELGGDEQNDFEKKLSFKEDDMEDGIFAFEEKPYQSSPPEEPEADDDDEEDSESTESPSSAVGNNATNLSQYSRSPGRPIQRPVTQQPSQPVGSSGVIGSFRGHPFSMPVVNDDMHKKALAMGDVSSFVGSVDGRTGFDDSDMASYRATAKGASFSGAPRSLTERMMLEDIMEAEKARRTKK